jgi:hypothetical protein
MTLAHKLDHEPEGVLKLQPAYWGKPRIAAWLVSGLAEVQAFEDAVWSYLDGLDVDTCERFALEGLAAIVGEQTRPPDTEELRMRVQARIWINRSDGTPSAVAGLIALLTSGEVHVLELAEEVRVLQYGADPYSPDVAGEMLKAACQGGKQTTWLTGCGTGSVRFPGYYDAAPDSTYCFGTGTWSEYHD